MLNLSGTEFFGVLLAANERFSGDRSVLNGLRMGRRFADNRALNLLPFQLPRNTEIRLKCIIRGRTPKIEYLIKAPVILGTKITAAIIRFLRTGFVGKFCRPGSRSAVLWSKLEPSSDVPVSTAWFLRTFKAQVTNLRRPIRNF
ncbi:unnamed protein product [Soboliphyme baturini]|uniref:Ig-like domain-containing protein n=1 Tax=Soboliphyme baturini TaxID=241478 RepID=A0A183IT69_9BILA|nr:unnamed protein product [Soboliphyme baturini]